MWTHTAELTKVASGMSWDKHIPCYHHSFSTTYMSGVIPTQSLTMVPLIAMVTTNHKMVILS